MGDEDGGGGGGGGGKSGGKRSRGGDDSRGKGGGGGKGRGGGKGGDRRRDDGDGDHRDRGDRGDRGKGRDRGGAVGGGGGWSTGGGGGYKDRGDWSGGGGGYGGGGYRGGKGGKGSRGQDSKQDVCRPAPLSLGKPVSATPPGWSGALGGPEYCLLCCTEAPAFVGVGKCRHTDVCWVCMLRLRALSQDKHCPVCKEHLDEVLITHRAKDLLLDGQLRTMSSLPLDESLGVRFVNEEVRKECMRLFEYRSRVKEPTSAGKAFGSLKELQNHLWYNHWLQFCETCLDHRPAFLCEQAVYDKWELEAHCKYGDHVTAGGDSAPPVPPHPKCEFCNVFLFDEEELMRHMNEHHHTCHICAQQGRECEYYADFKALEAHYQQEHFVCAFPACIHGASCGHPGYRLTVFATEQELAAHHAKVHGLGVSAKEVQFRVGLSYAEERAGGAGGGGGATASRARESNGAGSRGVKFCWPLGKKGDVANEQFKTERWEARAKRYIDREVLSDREEEDEAQCDGPGTGGGAAGEGETAEAPSGEADDDVDDDEAEADADAGGLDERLEGLSLDVTVAVSGRQLGMRNTLDALNAVLRILVPSEEVSVSSSAISVLRSAVGGLNVVDVESLERLRKDLDTEGSGQDDGLDWEPLERVLSLRPLFFRLLRNAVGGGTAAKSKAGIGPKTGPGAEDTSSADWSCWLRSAQDAVLSLGNEERHRLRVYVDLCMRRRADLTKSGFTGMEEDDVEERFPTLGGPAAGAGAGGAGAGGDRGARQRKDEPAADSNGPGVEGPGTGWGRRNAGPQDVPEAFPSLGPSPPAAAAWAAKAGAKAAAKGGAKGAAAKAHPPQERATEKARPAPPPAPGEEAFPAFGGGGAAPAVASSWGARQQKQPPPMPTPTPAKARGAAPPPAAAEFPSLGDDSVGSAAGGWAAQARERERKAAVAAAEPAPRPKAARKTFEGIGEGAFPGLPAFPDLPSAGPAAGSKSLSSAARAGAAAGEAARAKAKAAASRIVPDSWEDEAEEAGKKKEEEEELVCIHNPLDAVAASEAETAARKAKKGSKTGARKGTVINPWAR